MGPDSSELGKTRVGAGPRQQFTAVGLVDPDRRTDQQLGPIFSQTDVRLMVIWHEPRPEFVSALGPVPADDHFTVTIDQGHSRINLLFADSLAFYDLLETILDNLDIHPQTVLITHSQITVLEETDDRLGSCQFKDVVPTLREIVGDRCSLLLGFKLELKKSICLQLPQGFVVAPENCQRIDDQQQKRYNTLLVALQQVKGAAIRQRVGHYRPLGRLRK